MRVIIHNIIYDITTFINEHPGGPEVFSDADPDSTTAAVPDIVPDLTQRFNEVGHSEYAVNLLGNYKVEELSEDDLRFNRYNKLEYNKTKISKLVTHEDKFHIHKIMGLVSLLNYFYLLFDFFYSGATADMTLRKVDGGFIGLTWVHSILSLSALQFLIPRTRTGILPMIWQEFRAHSIVFAVRSFLIINALYFFTDGSSGSGSGLAVRFAIVLLAMKMADVSTEHLRENKKETTTATMPYWSDCPATLQSAIKYFYTHSQFMATIVCLFGKIPYILAVAFPIQIASFLMTLVRKNIISAFWYHVFYGGSLLIVYLINAADIALYPVVLTGFALIYARINLKINKYVLWTIVASASVSVGAVTVTGLLFYSIDVIFDKQHIREESNHRVQKNMTIRRDDDCDRPCDGPCDGSGIYREIVIQLCEKYSKYKPGMYFNLYFDTKKRPYTPVEYAATTGGGGDRATFLIKRVETGEVSPLICDKYLVNQTVFVKGPFGMKYYDPSPGVESFVCDTVKISAKYIVMCSCGTGITPFYSMGVAWTQSETRNQELHYLSSYHLREDAVLRIRPSTTTDSSYGVKERLYISNENTKLTPAALIDYLTGLIENSDETTRPEDIAVFICGTPTYSQMVKDACAIVSTELKWYEW